MAKHGQRELKVREKKKKKKKKSKKRLRGYKKHQVEEIRE